MQATVSALVLASLIGVSSASQHQVTLKVVSSYQWTLRGVAVGDGGESASTTTPCSQPYPDDAIAAGGALPGTVGECTFAAPAASITGSVQGITVKAILTADDRRQYNVVLYCKRQYGYCPALVTGTVYIGKLGEQSKWLSDYRHRASFTPMRVAVRLPDGKHKVSYAIASVAKVESTEP